MNESHTNNDRNASQGEWRGVGWGLIAAAITAYIAYDCFTTGRVTYFFRRSSRVALVLSDDGALASGFQFAFITGMLHFHYFWAYFPRFHALRLIVFRTSLVGFLVATFYVIIYIARHLDEPATPNHALQRTATAVAELGVVRRSRAFVPRITPAMTHSEPNLTSDSSDLVSESLRSSHLLGFAHAPTLAAMRRVSPASDSFALRLRTQSVRESVRLPGGCPPTPTPQFGSQPLLVQHGLPHAAGRSAVVTSERRITRTRGRWRKSERTPNHALQRTATAVTARASTAAFPPAMHGPRQPPPSLSLGSLGAAVR